jgi:peptide/nickel transport system substrate-binding protein
MMRGRLRLLSVTILVLASMALTPFGTIAAGPAQAPAAGTLVVGTTDKLSVFDPADVYDFHAWEIWNNTGDGLLNSIPGTAGKVQPGLAEKYVVSADGKEYTFSLRKGVTFPDGAPFNADAVKASIDRVITMAGKLNPPGEVAFLVTDYVAKVDKIDDYTVKFTLKGPYSFFPILVATNPYKIVDVKQWSTDKYDADNTASGIGPYKVTSWKRDEELVMEANSTYYGDKPKMSKVIIRYFADSSTMRIALEKGEIDIAWKSLSPADMKSVKDVKGIVVERQPGTEIRYVCYNAKTPPFDNAKVRTALGLMLNREEIADTGFQGTKVPLYSMVPPGFLGHIDAYKDADMTQATALLKKAGFTAEKPLEVPFWYSPSHYGSTEADVAALIKDQWEKSGVVKVTLQNAEWATYKEYRNKGSMPVFLLGWYPDYIDTDDYTYPFGHTGATDGLGIFYSNKDMDKLLEAAQVEPNETKRADLYRQIQELWLTENPTTPFAQGALFVAHKDTVKGIVLDPLALFHYFLVTKG